MEVPPIRWGDAESRTGDDIVITVSPSQQYLLQMLSSWLQLNPSFILSDYDEQDPNEITDGVDSLVNAVLAENVASLWKQARTPKLTGDMATVLVGTALTFSGNTVFQGGAVWMHGTPAINDKLQYSLLAMKAGSWSIKVVYSKDNQGGICTIKLNDVTTLLTIDSYAAAGTQNNIASALFTITDDDIYFITLRQAAKNASSGNYRFSHNFIELVRTGD